MLPSFVELSSFVELPTGRSSLHNVGCKCFDPITNTVIEHNKQTAAEDQIAGAFSDDEVNILKSTGGTGRLRFLLCRGISAGFLCLTFSIMIVTISRNILLRICAMTAAFVAVVTVLWGTSKMMVLIREEHVLHSYTFDENENKVAINFSPTVARGLRRWAQRVITQASQTQHVEATKLKKQSKRFSI